MWINTQLVVIKRCEKARKIKIHPWKKKKSKWNHLLLPSEKSVEGVGLEGRTAFKWDYFLDN